MDIAKTPDHTDLVTRRRPTFGRGIAAALLVGLVGGLLVVFLPYTIAGFDGPFLTLALVGLGGALVGRGWRGLIAVVGGALAGAVIGLVAWAVLGLSGAQFIPLAAAILAIAIPISVGGSYAVVRIGAWVVGRVRGTDGRATGTPGGGPSS